MNREPLLVAIVGVAIINGLFSPILLPQFVPISMLLLSMWQPSPGLLFFTASLGASTFTLVLSGVPAALYERFTGRQESTTASLLIWLAGAVVLTLPAFLYLAGPS